MQNILDPPLIWSLLEEGAFVLVEGLAIGPTTCNFRELYEVYVLIAVVIASAQDSLDVFPFRVVPVLL